MKPLLIFALVLIATSQALNLTEEQKAKVKKYFGECLDSTKADKGLVDKARGGEFTDDPKLKEFIGCMFTKTGLISGDNVVQWDVIKAKIPAGAQDDKMQKFFAGCKDTKGATVGETAFLLFECYHKNAAQKLDLIDI